MNSNECLKIRFHEADLTELIYWANHKDYTVVGARRIKPSVTSPRSGKVSSRAKEDEEYEMIASVVIPIITNKIRSSQLDAFESALKKEGRMIWKIDVIDSKKLKVYIAAAIFFKTADGTFQFERLAHTKHIEKDTKDL
ncbi:hypothetical protein [Estrella lausannensis]|uniref:Uncharacterized protein n=1 Tax=Estrella lausannensis TaxID=483423 RepID=A0A0H5DQ58_9BACT|nr:hypothetical protein [Estrella lausannensis]CRX38188.1 hypothetical protein ELAC_0839 [Estrella lausannensis]